MAHTKHETLVIHLLPSQFEIIKTTISEDALASSRKRSVFH